MEGNVQVQKGGVAVVDVWVGATWEFGVVGEVDRGARAGLCHVWKAVDARASRGGSLFFDWVVVALYEDTKNTAWVNGVCIIEYDWVDLCYSLCGRVDS